MSHVFIEADTYVASVLPDGHPERDAYELILERHGDRWAVRRLTGRWWDRDGNSEWLGGRLRDEDRERFLMRLAEARDVAAKVAPTLRVNGGPPALTVLEESS